MILTLWVDPQNDFADQARGALGVARGPARIEAMNAHMREHNGERIFVVSRDQHTEDTEPGHFGTYGQHCVIGTWGAAFHHRLQTTYCNYVINKGGKKADPSPWDGLTFDGLSLEELCRRHHVHQIEIGGFVAEVCVEAAWQGSVLRDYPTKLLVGCIAAIDPEDGMRDSVWRAIEAGVLIG